MHGKWLIRLQNQQELSYRKYIARQLRTYVEGIYLEM